MSSQMRPGGRATFRTVLTRSGTALIAGLVAASMLVPVSTAAAADGVAIDNPNSAMGYPHFYGSDDPTYLKYLEENGLTYDPSTSYLKTIFDKDVANGAGTDTAHDFYIDKILSRTGAQPNGTGENEAGEYRYEGADGNGYLFTRGRAAYMYSHTPGALGFVGDAAYWDQTGMDGFTITVSLNGAVQTMREDSSRRKQTPSYFTTVFTNADGTLTITETKYITENNVMVANLEVSGTADGEVTLTAESPFADTGENGATELTGRVNVKNNLTTLYPRFSGNGFTVQDGALVSTLALQANAPQTTKVQLGLIADELPGSTAEYEARATGDLVDPAASYQDSVTTYNQWWVDNIPYVETPEHNIDKTVVYRWWLARFNSLDANMPGNTFQYPTSIEGVLGYNNQIVLTSGMFINDTKWLRNPDLAYGTWVSAGQTAKKGESGYYYYHDNPGDPANWNHSYTQYITKAGWDSYKVHGGPSSLAEALGDYGSDDVNGLLNSASEPDDNDNQNDNDNHLIDWSWWSMTGNDADAVSFSEPGRGGQRMDRADGSANMWANANASAQAYYAAAEAESDEAKKAELQEKADAMQQTADQIQQEVLDELWNPETNLIQHKWLSDGAFAKYKENNNYYPYSVGLMPSEGEDGYKAEYEDALRLFEDADEFPIFPFFTANQADKEELGFPGSNNFSIINATPLLQIYSAGIRDYNADENGYITNESFKKLLYWVAFAHYQGGNNNYPDQNEFWNMDNDQVGDLNGDDTVNNVDKNLDATQNGGKITYRSWIHHTQLGTTNWTIIEDVAGMVPREDNRIELNPIAIPGWEHFTVNNLSYHGQDLSIVWNNDGTYNAPKGYTLYLAGKPVFTSDKLAHLIYDPATGTVEVMDDSGAQVTGAITATLPAANQVTYGADDRVTEIFATSGQNIDSASDSQIDVARGADVEATYEADGYPATNAVDGKNVMESFWGTKGSENAEDSITVTFKDGAQTIDDVRLYFYQTSSSQTITGYKEPSVYTLEYQDESGEWKALPNQVRTPTYAGANYNRIQFDPVTATAIRATFTPQAGQAIGLKSIQAYNTGIEPTAEPTNQAPSIDAYVDSSTSSGAEIVGVVKDDGLPGGDLDVTWTQVSGPEGGVASFMDDKAASTTVTFNIEGDYVLRLTASDGEKTSTMDVTVHGVPSDGTVNIASQATAKASSRNSYAIGDVAILNDGIVDLEGTDPMKSWNNWGQSQDRNPTVTYTWDAAVPLSKVQAYFWSDGGGVPMPNGWKVQVLDAEGAWQDVTLKDGQSYTVNRAEGNSVSFEQVWTTAMRVVFSSTPVGLSELEAYAADPLGVDDVHRMVQAGTTAEELDLPTTVSAHYADGSRHDLKVSWPAVTDDQLVDGAVITLNGTVTGALSGAQAILNVKSDADNQNSGTAQPIEQSVYRGAASIDLPTTVPVQFPNGAQDDRAVTWNEDEVAAIDLNTVNDYVVTGVADGASGPARLTVHVLVNPNDAQEPEPGPEPEPEPLEGWIEGQASGLNVSAEASWSPAAGKLNDGVVIDQTWPDTDEADVNAMVWGTWGQAQDGIYAEYTWNEVATIDSSRVQFWANCSEAQEDDPGLEIPDSWEIQYRDAEGNWVSVTPTADGAYTVVRNDPTHRGEAEDGGWSTVTFEPVETTGLRLVLHPHATIEGASIPYYGTAVAEWGVHAVEGEDPEPEPEPVDKTALKAAIDAASALDQNRFTPASWQVLAEALTNAQSVYANAEATEPDVTSATSALEDAQKNLVAKADKSALQTAIDAAGELDSNAYTEATWAAVATALETANTVLQDANATQQAVDNAAQALNDAVAALETKPVEPVEADKTVLKAAVDKADALREADYTPESWAVFAGALADAKAVLTSAEATQEQVDAAAETLQQAIRDLKPAETTDPDEPGAVDTTVLAATIAKGQAIDRAAYTAESLKALDEALSNAQQVLSDKDATQAQVDAAVQAIEDALAGLKPATGIEGQKPAGQLTSTGAAVIGVAAVALLALAGAVALAARRRMTGK